MIFYHSPDNVTLQIDGVLYLRILDPYKVSSRPLISFLMRYFQHLKWRSSDFHLLLSVPSGQLRSGGPRVRCHAAGPDHHAFWTGQTDSGQSVPGTNKKPTAASAFPPSVFSHVKSFTRLSVWSEGTRVPELQHRPLHQPGFRRVGYPLPPLRNQRHTRPASGQGVHADAGRNREKGLDKSVDLMRFWD